MIGWYDPACSHLKPMNAPIKKTAQATPPIRTLVFHGDRRTNTDQAGQKMNMGTRYSGR